ncbi:MAG: AAA family ATPase [Bacteroidales bacterium]|nr:AAA family ATPase [Bacteroidales bacterium]
MAKKKNIPDLDLDNAEFQDVFGLIRDTNSSVYMTGRAGTGKSTFLRYIVKHIKKKTVVLAPTGIAAVNAGGVTIHSFFKVPLHPFALDDVNFTIPARLKERQKYNKEKIKLLQEVELIVIDEVSMVRADLLDFVDLILRTYTNRRNVPFGGKQLLLVGDAFQLEPVVKREDWDILRRFYTSPYFFDAQVFKHIDLVQIELQKVYRQHETAFLSLLDRVRVSKVSVDDFNCINSRVVPNFMPQADQMYITLTTVKATADMINDTKLDEIDREPVTYKGTVTGDFPESSFPTNLNLVLKEGAQVVFVKNDMERRWYNGTIARVAAVEPDGVWAEDENGEKFFVAEDVWDNVRYKYDEKEHKVVEEVLGSFKQLPLRLAWAITIHKSQGLTFDHVIIDIGRGAFACGQVYVALSRCRTLDGIILRSPVTQRDIMTNNGVVAFSSEANNRMLIDKQFSDAEAIQNYSAASISFRQGNYADAVRFLFDALAKKPEDLNNPVARRLVSMRLGVIDRLDKEIKHLVRDKKKIMDATFEFAHEYYLLAVECKHKYGDSRSSRANLNKALRLSPDYIDALVLRCELELETGDYEQALADANAAVKADKRNEALLRNRAQVHIKMRNYGNAYNDLLAAMRYNDQDAVTYRLLSDVCHRLGDEEESERYRNIADALEGKTDFDEDDY